jgi:hypothetical protein
MRVEAVNRRLNVHITNLVHACWHNMLKPPSSSDSTDVEIELGVGSSRRGTSPAGSGLSAHILPASATMLGVCMTVLSIGHIGPVGEMHWVIDKLLAMDALVFLASAVLSFMSMRAGSHRALLELRAEWVFIVGLALLALAAMVLAFAIR